MTDRERPSDTETQFSEALVLRQPTSVANARFQIDTEVAKLYASIRILKTKRNFLSPITVLPAEILSRIFVAHASRGMSEFNSCPNIEWVRGVSHVCHHWRCVALDTPSLWCRIPFNRPSWALEMLQRSKMAALIIRADMTYAGPKTMSALEMALGCMSRVEELHLLGHHSLFRKFVTPLSQPAPMLKSLVLSRIGGHMRLSEWERGWPIRLFNSDAPCLRSLQIGDVPLDWPFVLFHGLVDLRIHTTHAEARPTIDGLMDILTRMPQLETLKIDDALPLSSLTDLPSPKATAFLPRLSVLCLSGTVQECANLLNHLKIPMPMTLSLTIKDLSSDQGLRCLFPALATVCNGLGQSGKPLRSAHIGEHPNGVCMTAWTSIMPLQLPRHSPQVTIKLIWRIWLSNYGATLKGLCEALSLNRLHSLGLEGISMEENSWLGAFGNFPSLRTLYLSGPQGVELVGAIMTTASGTEGPGAKSSTHRPFFAGLRKLVFDNVDFGDLDDGDDRYFEQLCDCLMMRCEQNASIRELHIIDCIRVTVYEVDKLLEIVVDVEWDGIENEPTEEENESDWNEEYYSDGVADSDYYGYDDYGSFY